MTTEKTGTVYKLYNSVNDKYYIGSSIQKYLNNRLATHQQDARLHKRPNNLLHLAMNEVGCDKWSMKILVQKTVQNRREICRIEDEYIDWTDSNCLNIKKASGVYRDEFDTTKDYEKARWQNASEHEKTRAKTKWQKIKDDPVKHEEYKRKQRERDWRRRALNESTTGVGR